VEDQPDGGGVVVVHPPTRSGSAGATPEYAVANIVLIKTKWRIILKMIIWKSN